MILDSLLSGVMLFSSLAIRTPNVQPNPGDYEVSIGVSHPAYYFNRQWERELGEPYIDDLFWIKIEDGIYFKPEYMNKESQSVKYFKIPVAYEIKGNFLGYIKFKRALARSNKMLNFDKEIISLVQNDPNGAIVAKGELTIVGLPNEFF